MSRFRARPSQLRLLDSAKMPPSYPQSPTAMALFLYRLRHIEVSQSWCNRSFLDCSLLLDWFLTCKWWCHFYALDGERCGETLKSIFENAKNPDKVIVGLAEQNAPDDAFCLAEYCKKYGKCCWWIISTCSCIKKESSRLVQKMNGANYLHLHFTRRLTDLLRVRDY